MSRGDYAPDEDGVVAEILRHLAEIVPGVPASPTTIPRTLPLTSCGNCWSDC